MAILLVEQQPPAPNKSSPTATTVVGGVCLCKVCRGGDGAARRAHLCKAYQNSSNSSIDSSSTSSGMSSKSGATTTHQPTTSRFRSLFKRGAAAARSAGSGSSSQKASSYRLPAVGLDIQGLERFLVHTVPRFTLDTTMARQAQTEFTGLAEKWWQAEQSVLAQAQKTSKASQQRVQSVSNGHLIKQQLQRASEQCHDELNNILILLACFLHSSSSPIDSNKNNKSSNNNCMLPPVVVYEVHLYAGQIQEVLHMTTNLAWRRRSSHKINNHGGSSNSNNFSHDNHNTTTCKFYDAAMASYMKALWVASFSQDISHDLLAFALHRLGKMAGRMGKVRQARDMLYRAVQLYSLSSDSHVPKNHPTLLDAEEFLHRFHIHTLALFGSSTTFSNSTSSSSSYGLSPPSSHAFTFSNNKTTCFLSIPEDSEFFSCPSTTSERSPFGDSGSAVRSRSSKMNKNKKKRFFQ